ncbi:MAG: hypothetical protein EB007_08980 [Betaproteobacteria bacterium]|nr:hypothetical protein [Betaproteobacteria bacterium]NDE73894.1 hypothetical protein [Betaproteobacteria bacterium]
MRQKGRCILDLIENQGAIFESPKKACWVNGSKVAFERVIETDVVGLLTGLMPEKGRLAGLPGSR